MKVIKIGAVWCGGCLITNKSFNKLKKEYTFNFEELDIDFDEEEVKKYNPGDKLPLFIIIDDNNTVVDRFTGEFNYNELKNKLKDVDVINE